MPFPQGPTTGQLAIVDGIQYQYNTTNNRWLRVANAVTATVTLAVTSVTNATSPTTGALTVAGGAGIGSDLWIAGTEYVAGGVQISSGAYNTSTGVSNSFYTAGGAYITKTLVVGGNATFGGQVIFSGTATFVASTNTYYTSPVLELHTPSGGVSGSWTFDDNYDIGQRFHYYNRTTSADDNAALVLADNTQYLTWYGSGATNGSNNFSTATFGTFKTGRIILAGGNPNTLNTTTGDLQVQGGVGIGQNLYVANNLTVGATTTITGYLSVSSAISTLTGVLSVSGNSNGSYQAPQNVGVMLQLTGQVGSPSRIYNDGQGTGNYSAYIGRHYNGTTVSPTELNANDIIARFGATAYTTGGWAPISNARIDMVADEHQLSTSTGSRLDFWITPVGSTVSNITRALTIGTSGTSITNTTNSVSTTTGALTVAGGVGVGGNLYVGGKIVAQELDIQYTTITTTLITTPDIFTITNTTAVSNTVTGALVVAGGVGIAGGLYVGGSVTATNFYGSFAGNFAGTATSAYTAVTATNIAGGTTGSIHYQTAAGATGFIGIGNTGSVLTSNGTTATYSNTLTLSGTLSHTGLVPTAGLNIDQVYTTSTTLTLTRGWQNTGISGSQLSTGTYIVQCVANDSAAGGGQVNTYYSGIMSWYAGATTESSYDEILLHRAGAASSTGSIYLQVLRAVSGTMSFQISGNYTNTTSSTYTFNFRRMI